MIHFCSCDIRFANITHLQMHQKTCSYYLSDLSPNFNGESGSTARNGYGDSGSTAGGNGYGDSGSTAGGNGYGDSGSTAGLG